jgi:hypothetical protein
VQHDGPTSIVDFKKYVTDYVTHTIRHPVAGSFVMSVTVCVVGGYKILDIHFNTHGATIKLEGEGVRVHPPPSLVPLLFVYHFLPCLFDILPRCFSCVFLCYLSYINTLSIVGTSDEVRSDRVTEGVVRIRFKKIQ